MLPLKILAVLAALVASGVVAAPWDPTSRHATHRVRTVGPNNVKITTYHPPGIFKTFGVGIEHPLSNRDTNDLSPTEIAQTFLQDQLAVSPNDLSRTSGYSSDTASFEYFHQMINETRVANAVANCVIKDGKVVAFGANFVKPKSVASNQPKLTAIEATTKAITMFGGKYNNWPIKQEYIVKDTDHCVLTYVIQIQNDQLGEWREAFVDAETGEVVHMTDFVADASYLAIPLNKQDSNQEYAVQNDPADKVASPNGWHSNGSTNTTETSGNNVITYKSLILDVPKTTSRQSSATNNYSYRYTSNAGPATSPNVDAARVNAFYVGNMVHDLTYRYGFTEATYNFQNDNHGKGGAGNDRVQISVQDSSGTNNANFATPPDGQPGQMRMFTWTYTTPSRDGGLENDIIAHEYAHGVSNRLTGGGTGQCLQTTEAGGMGEGWSDTLASITEINSSPLPDFTLGGFVTGNKKGIRSYPYSTNMTTNPLTYASLATKTEVHDIGECWAVIWHEIIAAFLEAYGYQENRFDSTGTAGNIVVMHLFINAFQIQSCNPTFLSARDAIVQADVNRYNGANKCLLWRAFAKRGLGTGATSAKVNNADLPDGC